MGGIYAVFSIQIRLRVGRDLWDVSVILCIYRHAESWQ